MNRDRLSTLKRLQMQAAQEEDVDTLKKIAKQILRLLRQEQSEPSRPWVTPLLSLRKKLHLSQAQLAARVDCSAMTVSRWERGLLEPSTHCLLELGKLAGSKGGWDFWNLAGITAEDVRAMLTQYDRRRAE